ncbi:MAG: MaoC family dehydratase N-terminal domain-containing protein [Candidatus Binataceae bacterium]|jgi:acyl dehydratase
MVDYDPQLIGRVIEGKRQLQVTDEMITAYCAAIGDTNPLYAAGAAGARSAPPGFAGIFRLEDRIFDNLPKFGKRRLAGGIDIEFLLPIRAGDTISTVTEVREIYEKTGRTGPMVFIVLRSALKNQNGDIAAYLDHRFVIRP